tara:strand:- start:950 stop:1093 length:144 start_codon:yes stop_codon:yes gene_type:complete
MIFGEFDVGLVVDFWAEISRTHLRWGLQGKEKKNRRSIDRLVAIKQR